MWAGSLLPAGVTTLPAATPPPPTVRAGGDKASWASLCHLLLVAGEGAAPVLESSSNSAQGTASDP